MGPFIQVPVISVPPIPAIDDGQEDEDPGIAVQSVGLELEMTPREALDILLAAYPMPEDATLIDTEDFLGWQTPLTPVGGDTSPNAQQSSIRLAYRGLSNNGKYHVFWVYSFLLDDPSQELSHCSTLNFYAVPLEGDEILVERHYDENGNIDEIAEMDYIRAVSK